MSSKPRKQSLQIRCYYDDDSSGGTYQHGTSKVSQKKRKPESDPLELKRSSSSSLQEPQKNIVKNEPEVCKQTTALKTKISRITCCGQHFEKKFGFRKHVITKHPSMKEELQLRLCLNCHTMVKATEYEMIIHMKKIHKTNSPGNFVSADDEFLNKNGAHSFLVAMSKMALECKECNALFLDKNVYKEHQKFHEEPPKVNLFYRKECECGITFHEDGQYQSHWYLMHSGNFSPCSHCHALIDSKNVYAHVEVKELDGIDHCYYACPKAAKSFIL